jgi:hypothetical protein
MMTKVRERMAGGTMSGSRKVGGEGRGAEWEVWNLRPVGPESWRSKVSSGTAVVRPLAPPPPPSSYLHQFLKAVWGE